MKIDHIGYITNNIEDTCREFNILGYTLKGDLVIDERQNCRLCIMESEAGDKIEMVEPCDDNVQMLKILKKRGCSSYHICYEVDDVMETYKSLSQKEGWISIFKPVHAPALENRLITYFYNIKIGFVEFVNSK